MTLLVMAPTASFLLDPNILLSTLFSNTLNLWLQGSYEGVSKSFRTGRLEWELQMVELSTTRCSCIAILWVSLVSFAAITLCFASQRVFIVVYFVIDTVRKLLYTPCMYGYMEMCAGIRHRGLFQSTMVSLSDWNETIWTQRTQTSAYCSHSSHVWKDRRI
jgi:hypothetical protein